MNYWYNVLTFDERVYYERCIHAILHYYSGNLVKVASLCVYARKQDWSNLPLIQAILWRLHEELCDDADNY